MTDRTFADIHRTHPVYAAMPAEYRRGGSIPVDFIHVTQGSHEAADPPQEELGLGLACGPCRGTLEMDYGDGVQAMDIPSSAVGYLNPTGTSTRQTLRGTVEIVLINAPFGGLASQVGMEVGAIKKALAPLHERLIVEDPLLRPLGLSMWRAAVTTDESSDLYIDQSLLALSLYLIRLARGTTPGAVRFADGERAGVAERLGGTGIALDDVRVRRALDVIEARLGGPLSLSEIAAEVGLGPSHFARAFKRAVGEPLWRFVLRRRVERARALIESTSRPLAEIALDCGFSSQTHFGRTFARRYGVSPGRYRRGVRPGC